MKNCSLEKSKAEFSAVAGQSSLPTIQAADGL